MTPLHQQMVAALELNGQSPATVEAYVREVALVAKFYCKRPDRISGLRQEICANDPCLIRESSLLD